MMNLKNTGFVIEQREIMNNEWYTDPNTMHLYRHCRLRANYADAKWRGIELKRGQFVTSLATLSRETGLSVRSVRTALDKLTATGYLTNKTSNKNRIITVLNYDSEQLYDKQTDKQTTTQRQTSDNQTTTDNKNNKENKENKNNKYFRRESNPKRNCSYELADVMEIEDLSFMDNPGWEENAFGRIN